MRDRSLLFALALFVASATAFPAAAAEKETWFDITFHGSKVGYVRARSRVTKLEGKPAVHVDRWSVITVRRRDEVIRMEHTVNVWFQKDGTPLRYKIERKEGGELRSGEGYRDGQAFVVRHAVGGRTRTRRFDLAKGDRLASSLDWLHLQDPQPGLRVEGRAIDESEGDRQDYSLTVAKTPDKGVYLATEKLGGIETSLQVGSDGVRRIEVRGAGIVMSRTTRAEAIRVEDTVDIFSKAMFTVDVDLPPRDHLSGLTLVFSADRELELRKFEGQPVKRLARGQVQLETKAAAVPRRGPGLPVRKKALAKYLSATDYEDLDDEALIATARREVGDAKDAWTAARRINAFVHRHLEDKTLAHAFASATEALSARAGDCTEHAVLFSALAKISGVPTRLVTGLVYVGGAQPAFGYHEWVEVWLGERWHPMDPTFGQDVADATHVKFSQGLSDAAGLREAGLAAAALIGDVELEVKSFEVEGVRVRP